MLSASFRGLLLDPSAQSALRAESSQSKPFPHLILKNIFDSRYLHTLAHHFPRPDDSWWKYENALERKFAKDDLDDEHPILAQTIAFFHSKTFVEFLENVTGISGLIVDAKLRGGGMHQITRGGKLDIHADYNVHPDTGLDRRLNVILYLNPGWKPEWKGCLELWNQDMTACQATIVPELGTLVIFSTNSESYHGHPDPLECPDGVNRRSMALYYYSNGRPESEKRPPHSTLYQKRPQDLESPELNELRAKRAKGRL